LTGFAESEGFTGASGFAESSGLTGSTGFNEASGFTGSTGSVSQPAYGHPTPFNPELTGSSYVYNGTVIIDDFTGTYASYSTTTTTTSAATTTTTTSSAASQKGDIGDS
jgi:transposase InsO family protein